MRLKYLKLAAEKLTLDVGKSNGNDNQLFLLQQNNAPRHTIAQTINFLKVVESLQIADHCKIWI